ncbi:MAG: DUF3307 domain-containing protein [Bacteroidota bacterium]
MMVLLAKLFIAHLVGDFILFRNKRLKEKGKPLWKSRRLLAHSVVHFLFAWIALGYINWWAFAIAIGFSHYAGDLIIRNWLSRRPQWAFVIDQLFHGFVIFVIAAYASGEDPWLQTWLTPPHLTWITLAGLVAVTFPAAKFIEVFLSQWPPAKSADKVKGLANAGLWIGILERVLIYILITTGHWEGIGFLLAAKSVFRFGDLSNSKDISLTEYIMVGTFLSFLIAIVTGLFTNHLSV